MTFLKSIFDYLDVLRPRQYTIYVFNLYGLSSERYTYYVI